MITSKKLFYFAKGKVKMRKCLAGKHVSEMGIES